MRWHFDLFCEKFKIFTTFTLEKLSKIECCAKKSQQIRPVSVFFSFPCHFYGNNYLQNCDKISCKKIVLNFGFLSPKFIYISNLSSFLQLLTLNKAYYLKIKVGLIIVSRQNLLNFAAILELLRNFQISVVGNPTLDDTNRQIPAIVKMGNRGTGESGNRETRKLRNRETLHFAILPLL